MTHNTVITDTGVRAGNEVFDLAAPSAAKGAMAAGVVGVRGFLGLRVFLKVQDNLLAGVEALVAEVNSIRSGKEPFHL